MNKESLQLLETLLEDEDSAKFWDVAFDTHFSWEQFRLLEMPKGFTPEEMWELVCALRIRFGGGAQRYYLPIGRAWVVVDSQIAAMCQTISARSTADAPLAKAIAERTGSHLLIEPVVNEILAATQRDGLSFDYETVRALVLEDVEAISEPERLVSNVHRLLLDLGGYLNRTCDKGLLEEFSARITSGCEELGCVTRVGPSSFHEALGQQPDYLRRLVPGSIAAIEAVCAIANGDGEYACLPPVIRGTHFSAMWFGFRPSVRWNSLLELALRRLLFLKAGLPVLAWVPYSKAYMAWEDGVTRPPEVVCAYEPLALVHVSPRGYWDARPAIESQLMMIIRELDVLDEIVGAAQAREEHLVSLLSRDPGIGSRQIETILQALRSPDVSFTVKSYCEHYSVTNPTARHDLLGLVDLGFFRCEQENRALVFMAYSELPRRIERHKVRSLADRIAMNDSNHTG